MNVLLGLLMLAAGQSGCERYVVTGYVAAEYPGWTADGSTTAVGALARGEPIAAGSYNLPFDTLVAVDGLGQFRIADRGHLGARHIDILVRTRAEAYALTSWRDVCVIGRGAA